MADRVFTKVCSKKYGFRRNQPYLSSKNLSDLAKTINQNLITLLISNEKLF